MLESDGTEICIFLRIAGLTEMLLSLNMSLKMGYPVPPTDVLILYN